MPVRPSQIDFVCESCREFAKPRHVRRYNGRCRYCHGQSWTLLVHYRFTEVRRSPMGMLSAFTFGIGWYTANTVTNQSVVPGVPAETARWLTERRWRIKTRVVQHVREYEQNKLRELGAKPCGACGILYVPSPDKPWTQGGYCSKSCAANDAADISAAIVAPANGLSTNGRPRMPTLSVVCPNGHRFDVLASFSGCVRPCVNCGAKTLVPSHNA